MTIQPDWEKVEKMVGMPDYGVQFCVSPWPDGGWMAGIVVTDLDYVREQVEEETMDPCMLDIPHSWDHPDWDVFDGFKPGINVMGDDAADAIDCLWEKIHGDPEPPRRHQREQ